MGSEECIIQVNEEESKEWVRQMEEEIRKVEEYNRWEGMSIYRVPLSLKKLSEKAYQPQMVAVGPYHHGEEQLEGMEEHKKRALKVFLDRSNKPLDVYVDALTPMLQDLKNAYQQLQPKLKCSDFLKMMVVDGCFLLELMRSDKELSYARNDPVFSKYGLIYSEPHLKRDMLMLENQIPLRVLNALADVARKDTDAEKDKYPDVTNSILNFFGRHDKSSNDKFKNSLHILDVYRRSLLSFKSNGGNGSGSCWCTDMVRGMFNGDCINSKNKNKNDEKNEKDRKSWIVDKISCLKKKKKTDEEYPKKKNDDDGEYHMRPATDLAEAGIQCVKSGSPYLDQISFDKGKLMLPPIWVDDATKTIYLNMMAFEWFHVNRCLTEEDKNKDNYKEGFHVIAYVFFMDRLIDTPKDVSLLHKHHIMQYSLGSDQSVADIFNALSTDMCIDPNNKLEQLQLEVAKYYRKPMPGCIAYAKRNYFANTWVTLSIFAAIFLFALTITQTVFAVLDYYKSDAPPPPPGYHKP